MKKQLLYISFSVLFIQITSVAQEIPDSLKEGMLFTYLSIEHVWYGEFFKSNDATRSRYRLISRVSNGVRDLLVEKVDYFAERSGKTFDSPENVKLISVYSLCCDELFPGTDVPGDPRTPIALDKWESYNCVVLRVGSMRYIIKFEKLPLTDIHAIDEKGKVIDLPPDP